jgi:CRP-like cAMP-binding protein
MSVDAQSELAEVQPQETPQQTLSPEAARNLATTTKTVPQMQGITSRWLLRMIPWVEVSGGTYRVNRRMTYALGGGKIAVAQTADRVSVVAPSLREIPVLAGYDDDAVLAELAAAFTQREVSEGDVIAELGQPVDQVYVVAHGKIRLVKDGAFGSDAVAGVVGDGGYLGEEGMAAEAIWGNTAVAMTDATLLALPRTRLQAMVAEYDSLRDQLATHLDGAGQPQNRRGEADIAITSGHNGEPLLPSTFADYELKPREYQLNVAQAILRVHTRVADLFNDPMDQVKEQLRLTVEALRERQEYEMVNNPEFGLLHNSVYSQRIHTHSGPPTPDDMDELLSRRRSTRMFLAHPQAIAAFSRECTKRGIYPTGAEVSGGMVPAWRGVPIFPCNKIPVSDERTTSIIAMRTGEEDQGVVGLRQTGIPDEFEPGLNVRFMGINDQAIMSYLVSTYFSAAVLVPDALGILEHVEVSRPFS